MVRGPLAGDLVTCERCGGTTWITQEDDGYTVVLRCPEPTCQPREVAADPGKNKVGVRRGARATEKTAAYAHYPKSGSTRLEVLRAFADVYPQGLTHEELGVKLGNPWLSTYRARASELEKGGWIQDSGERRNTHTGGDSTVWVLTDKGARRENVLYRLLAK